MSICVPKMWPNVSICGWVCKDVGVWEHQSGLVNKACDSWSWRCRFEPHARCREYLKKKKNLKKKVKKSWTFTFKYIFDILFPINSFGLTSSFWNIAVILAYAAFLWAFASTSSNSITLFCLLRLREVQMTITAKWTLCLRPWGQIPKFIPRTAVQKKAFCGQTVSIRKGRGRVQIRFLYAATSQLFI